MGWGDVLRREKAARKMAALNKDGGCARKQNGCRAAALEPKDWFLGGCPRLYRSGQPMGELHAVVGLRGGHRDPSARLRRAEGSQCSPPGPPEPPPRLTTWHRPWGELGPRGGACGEGGGFGRGCE